MQGLFLSTAELSHSVLRRLTAVASAPCAPESNKKKGLHVAQPIDYFLAVLSALAALSTAYVAWDRLGKNPEPVLMGAIT